MTVWNYTYASLDAAPPLLDAIDTVASLKLHDAAEATAALASRTIDCSNLILDV
jgi:hypothetical protein